MKVWVWCRALVLVWLVTWREVTEVRRMLGPDDEQGNGRA